MLKLLADYLAFLACAAVFGLMRRLPHRAGYAVARGIVALVCLFMPRLATTGLRNLELAFPDAAPEERAAIFRRSLGVLAKNLHGFARIPDLTPESARELLDLDDFLRQSNALKSGLARPGVLYAAAHYGPFEFGVQAWAIRSGPLSILARGFGMPRLDAWWNKRREKFGCEVFSRVGGYLGVHQRLQAGQDVVLLFDQNVKRNHAVFAPLFGIPAATTKTVAVASLRTGAPIIFATAAVTESGRLLPYFEFIGFADDREGTPDEKIQAVTADINAALERAIRAHPEQWFWIHRRFKTRPQGEPESLYD